MRRRSRSTASSRVPYEFGNLSPADFEDLVRDLVGRELGVRFEAFAAGPDGGMDGRHAKSGATTILQAKHYAGATYASLSNRQLRSALRRCENGERKNR